MKKLFGLVLVFFASTAIVFAAQAEFSVVNGKVEYQLASGEWRPARVGDKIDTNVLVSTGFKSNAVLKLNATSISMRPLTRLTLEQMQETSEGSQTQLLLLAGRVRADVPPQEGKTTEFTVKSTTATASVRGTSFEFDGRNLIVDRGAVQLGTRRGRHRRVAAGEFGFVADDGNIQQPVASNTDIGLEALDQLMTQAESEELALFQAPTSGPRTTDIVITVE